MAYNPKPINEENLRKGHDFERFVVSRFPHEQFELIEWRSDKCIDGIYPTASKNPDLLFSFKASNYLFAVECKWRNHSEKKLIKWLAGNHLENYKRYFLKTHIKTFIVYGLGGTPDNPHLIYLLSLDQIERRPFLSYEEAMQFVRADTSSLFRFNPEQKILI